MHISQIVQIDFPKYLQFKIKQYNSNYHEFKKYRPTARRFFMTELTRTTSESADFIALVKLLDADLAERDGKENTFYAQYNTINTIRHVVVAYVNGRPVGCGAIKEFSPTEMEVKRMYTIPELRGKGVAGQVLKALENWATEMNYQQCVLETGKRQPEAIALYTKAGYNVTENYGQYIGVENSVCFCKQLHSLVS